MDMLDKKQRIFVIGGAIFVVFIIAFYYFSQLGGSEEFEDESFVNEEIESDVMENANMIIVHITGAVNNEGVVEVRENARINDVIIAAGGLSDEADLSSVNLAYVVEDGQKIYIPSKEDSRLSELNEEELVDSEAGKGVIKDNEKNSGSLININSANRDKLTEIPGVGDATAEKIVTYREENGKFKNIEDLKNVSGIGDKKFDAIKSYICV